LKGGEYRQEEGRRTKNDGMNRSAGKRQWELEKLIRGRAGFSEMGRGKDE
jgi:hypothetical protein